MTVCVQTEADRHYILEEKARTYSALQAGTQYDDAAIYHVKFRPGGQLSEEELPPGPVPPEFELQRMEQGQINWQGEHHKVNDTQGSHAARTAAYGAAVALMEGTCMHVECMIHPDCQRCALHHLPLRQAHVPRQFIMTAVH